MRDLFKNLGDEQLHTTVSFARGEVLPVTQVPIKEFSQKKWEDGYGLLIDRGETEIFAPTSGKITKISENGNAYEIQSDDGLEMLIHLGVDTDGLGKGYFLADCKVGQRVEQGEQIGRVELEKLYEEKICPISYLIFLSGEEVRLRKHHAPVGPDDTEFYWCAKTEKLI